MNAPTALAALRTRQGTVGASGDSMNTLDRARPGSLVIPSGSLEVGATRR